MPWVCLVLSDAVRCFPVQYGAPQQHVINCTYFTHAYEKLALPLTALRETFAGGFHVRIIFLQQSLA